MDASGSMAVGPGAWRGGRIRVPGDKSISNRIAMLAALADGESVVRGFLWSEDCRNILAAMGALGARHSYAAGVLRVQGTGGRLSAPAGVIDLGNSGTGMRLLAGLLAGQAFTSELTGDASLRSRPMRRIQEPLQRMGARVELLGSQGCAPVRIHGGGLQAIEYALPVASAQVKSCVLLAGLFAEGRTRVIEPAPTRDHTERLLRAMGVPVETDDRAVALNGFGGRGPRLQAREWDVPGDFSSAAFWATAAAVVPGRSIRIEGVGLNPRRTALLGVLRRMGAHVRAVSDANAAACETMGTLEVAGAELTATEVGGREIPDLIDELPLVAVAGALARGRTVIRDAAELRVKESDRIAAVAANLRAMGVAVEERPDGMVVEGLAPLRGGAILDSYGDHRVPMAFSILALSAGAPVRIRGVACVDKSYPEFWDDLRKVGGYAAASRGD